MAAGTPFVLTPPITAVIETLPVTFDFGPMLFANFPPNTYITGIDGIAITVVPNTGADPAPQNRLIGSPIITTSPSYTTMLAGAVKGWFGTMIGGCVYLLTCSAALSDGISHIVLDCQLPCTDPGS